MIFIVILKVKHNRVEITVFRTNFLNYRNKIATTYLLTIAGGISLADESSDEEHGTPVHDGCQGTKNNISIFHRTSLATKLGTILAIK
jgi:hypothetical protein